MFSYYNPEHKTQMDVEISYRVKNDSCMIVDVSCLRVSEYGRLDRFYVPVGKEKESLDEYFRFEMDSDKELYQRIIRECLKSGSTRNN